MNIMSEKHSHNPDKRIYHTDFVITESDTDTLDCIEGVDFVVRLGFYRAEIRKGRMFEWDKVDQKVVERLTKIGEDRT